MKTSLTLIALCFALLCGAQEFVGTIADKDGKPVMAALVKAGDYGSSITDLNGVFRVKGVTPGEKLSLRFSHLTYMSLDTVLLVSLELTASFVLRDRDLLLKGVEVTALRADDRTPFAQTTVDREELERLDVATDVPFLLDLQPSVVVTSDAGTGIGYTGMRIRGSDPTRINVTINGVPLNDAESSTVFWVNTADLVASTEDIQVQRGVGTSTNGPGAFGASVNLSTTGIQKEAYGRGSAFGGSFNTRKFNFAAGSGVLKNGFSFDARLSRIQSDGFIDRATADLNGYYLQGAWSGKKSSLRLIGFGGQERTYQAWYGVPAEIIDTNRTYNFYTYDNEVDNYGQQHYQLIFNHQFNEGTQLNVTMFRTDGAGYFEQYKDSEDLADYFIPYPIIGNDTVTTTDIIRRRWLDNTLLGGNLNLQKWFANKHRLVVGGGYNRYDGDHFGEVIWAQIAGNSQIRDRYYDNNADKTDANIFAKYTHALHDRVDLFGDLQYRSVGYDFLGIDANGIPLDQSVQLGFFNPKAGITFRPSTGMKAFASVAVGNKEPNRSDYTESAPGNQPVAEQLTDYELGFEFRDSKKAVGVNLYYMDYSDQLVLTGELNDVGAPRRVNVAESFRRGVELYWGVKFNKLITWNGNIAFSENKILNYSEFVDDWDTWEQIEFFVEETQIAFSPSVVAASDIRLSLMDNDKLGKAELSFISKYVGEQFIDNSGLEGAALDAWLVHDLRLNWNAARFKGGSSLMVNLALRNVLDEEYESNGWSYQYFSGGERAQLIGLYPQAGRNFLGGITLEF